MSGADLDAVIPGGGGGVRVCVIVGHIEEGVIQMKRRGHEGEERR